MIESVLVGIDYSEGNIEKHIFEILKNEKNLSSSNNISQKDYSNWNIQYHLSSIRSNCIRHLNFEGLDVLELGAGMGAVSRFVAENAKHLTVVEGTQQRFDCLSQRLRDLSNWDGFVANYQDFKSDKKYDMVCFFGVLEYAGRYIKQENPFLWAIKHAKSFLKENGVLLITIENKNGLKYFSGATEDHFGKHFHGICGYSEVNDIKTFSKKEMLDMLKEANFAKTDIHYLAPDYKLARAIMTEDYIDNHPISAANIMTNFEYEDYSDNKQELFNEKLAAVSLAKSGLLKDFTNSYLFLAVNQENSTVYNSLCEKIVDEHIEAFVYTRGRKNEIETDFINKNGNIVVRKKSLNNQNSENNLYIESSLNYEAVFVEGVEVYQLLLNYAYYNNYDEFLNLIKSYIAFAFEKYKTDKNDILTKNAFDAIIRNAILKDGKFYNFDNEFTSKFEITKDYFIFRNIWGALKDFVQYFNHFPFKNLYSFYEYLCKEFNVKPQLKENIEIEVKCQNDVAIGTVNKKKFKKLFDRRIVKKDNSKYLKR